MSAEPLPQEANNIARVLMLVYGRMKDGKGSYWCYVAVKPTEFERFRSLHKAGQVNLYAFEDDGFGEIVVSGTGLTPPQEITRQVAKVYGIAIRDLFGEVDPQAVITAKIAQMKAASANTN